MMEESNNNKDDNNADNENSMTLNPDQVTNTNTNSNSNVNSSNEIGSDADVQAMTDEIEAAEQAVSQAFWSTLNVVSDGLSSMTTNTNYTDVANPSSNRDHRRSKDSDLDMFFNDAAKEETETTTAAESNDSNSTPIENEGDDHQVMEDLNDTYADTNSDSVVSSFWSTISSVAETAAVSVSTTVAPLVATEEEKETSSSTNIAVENETSIVSEAASSLYSLYTHNYNHAAGWIDDLEQKQNQEDPHKQIKDHLDVYLRETSNVGTYEEWIRRWISHQGWDEQEQEQEQTQYEIPSQYYVEESVHRNIWNERVHTDGVRIEDENPLRSYVPAPTTEIDRRHPSAVADDDESDDEDEYDDEVVFVTAPEAEEAAKATSTDPLFTDDEKEKANDDDADNNNDDGHNYVETGDDNAHTTHTPIQTSSDTTTHETPSNSATFVDDSDLDALLMDTKK